MQMFLPKYVIWDLSSLQKMTFCSLFLSNKTWFNLFKKQNMILMQNNFCTDLPNIHDCTDITELNKVAAIP